MLTMGQLSRVRVFMPGKQSRKEAKAGAEPQPKKLGRVHNLVFAPSSRRVVGIMVKRPDVAGMVKREDVFCALDALKPCENGLFASGDAAFDAEACKRLGINLDECIVWEGADVVTVSGKPLGYVMDARFSEATGEVDCFCAQEGSTASALVGTFDIPAAWVKRYDKGRMIVDDRAAGLELSGGLAGKAGEGYANAKESAKEAAAKAGAAAEVAVDKGTHGLGRALGKAKVSVQGAVEGFQQANSSDADSAAASGTAAAGGGASGAASAPSASKSGSTSGKGVASTAKAADNGQKAARAVGEQLGKTKGMFSDFMREFKDASK